MNKRRYAELALANFVLAALAALPVAAFAQTPVDDNGDVIGTHQPAYSDEVESGATGNEDIPLMSDAELEELIGPIALYPDDLLAIVLPAAAYPLQIIDAARFLEELETDSTLKPDPEWDDSVVALLNYPEVIELLNEDIDWTWRLGEAVVSQQGDVVAAIETFRDRAYAAGNLKSDSYQNVTRDDGVIEITPVTEDVIYVPYYEPERVVVYQPRPVYYYYPRSYPVYYYPYSSAYDFDRGYFWGVTTAFTIGWLSDSLHVYHHSYYGHPYYGHSYWDRWWYRRPSINVYNTTYSYNSHVTINRYYTGDTWRPRHNRRDYVYDERITRNRYYQPSGPEPRVRQRADIRNVQRANTRTVQRQAPITFRDRPAEHRSSNRQTPVRQTRDQQRRPTPTQSVQEPSQSDLQARLQQRRQAPTQRVQQRRESDVQARQQQGRQTPAQRVQEGREPVRQVTPQRRSTPTQRQAVLQRSTERRASQQATVQQRREPAAQQRQVRREPPRQTRSPERVQRATPPRQESRAPTSEPKRAKPRKSESRSESGRRSENRARH